MELLETVIIALQLTNIFARKRHKDRSSSEESIENILYYKDCNHKSKNVEQTPLRSAAPPPPKPQECKMSCTMCCGGECINNDQTIPAASMLNERSMVSPMLNQMPRQLDGPIQPMLRPRKKKIKEPLLPPIGGRRNIAFTRENIKRLIAQDEDIKKILKDLVKVTMQKVDLVEMINEKRNDINTSEQIPEDSENDEEI